MTASTSIPPTPATGTAPDVAPVAFPDLGPGVEPGRGSELDLLADVDLAVTVELGRVRLKVRDLLRLTEGSVVELDRAVGAPVDVLVNGSLIARGDIVVVDDELGVRVTELLRRA
ncbi:MAG TPA: flagellar motor switch protein FliN [Egibacteraceae bacterium]|jgi:flagellar motor switch protein FliN|nr:flagellar motor switch protein FliN [Egibacteraceae bacterium]